MLRRFTHIDLVVAAVVAVVAGTVAIGSPAAVPSIPAIYVDYNPNCTFTMTVDGGYSITSATAPGPTLPPGTYQLLVWLANPIDGYVPCGRPTFTFTGAGVNSLTEFRGQELLDEHVVVLQPSSAYVAEDANAPGQTRKVFTTAASGSSSVLVGSTPGTQSGPSKASVQVDIIGSAIMRYRGKLVATVGASGKATLKLRGRNVASLKAGKYDIKVDDAAARAGFFVQRRSRKAVTVTSRSFVGERTQRVTLAAGKWTFFSKVGKPTRLTVVA